MPFRINEFTSKLDYYVDVSTGAEIVTLLEALTAGSRLSHDDGLSDVSADDHHVAFVQGDADLLYGAIGAVALNTAKVTCNFTNVQTALAAASGAIGVGIATPTCAFHVDSDLTGADGELFILDRIANADAAILIRAGGVGKHSKILFGDPDANQVGKIDYDHANDSLIFRTNTTKGLNISSAGDVDIIDHNAATVGLTLGGVLVTKSAAQINAAPHDFTTLNAIIAAADAAIDLNDQALTSVGAITCDAITASGIVIVGAHQGSDYLAIERYSSGLPYAYILGGSSDQNVSVPLRFQPKNAAGDGINVCIMDGDGNINIELHDGATVGLKLGGTLVTASAAELNLNDGASYGANDSGGVGFRAIKVPNL